MLKKILVYLSMGLVLVGKSVLAQSKQENQIFISLYSGSYSINKFNYPNIYNSNLGAIGGFGIGFPLSNSVSLEGGFFYFRKTAIIEQTTYSLISGSIFAFPTISSVSYGSATFEQFNSTIDINVLMVQYSNFFVGYYQVGFANGQSYEKFELPHGLVSKNHKSAFGINAGITVELKSDTSSYHLYMNAKYIDLSIIRSDDNTNIGGWNLQFGFRKYFDI